MVKLTYSLRHWLIKNHPDILPLVLFGHVETLTAKVRQEYLNWCQSDEGKRYLVGGDLYETQR